VPACDGNGSSLPVPKPTALDDSQIIEFVRSVGVSRVLDAAVAVERQH
jgi:hypothetical protein